MRWETLRSVSFELALGLPVLPILALLTYLLFLLNCFKSLSLISSVSYQRIKTVSYPSLLAPPPKMPAPLAPSSSSINIC